MSARTGLPGLLFLAAITAATAAAAREPASLHQTLSQLTREGKFSGAVVIRGDEGVRFARGYGFADPFSGRRYTPDTPADSGSAPKPMTAAAVLMLARDGAIDLDSPVRRYVAEYPHAATAVRQLLAHSAGAGNEGNSGNVCGEEQFRAHHRGRQRQPETVLSPPGRER